MSSHVIQNNVYSHGLFETYRTKQLCNPFEVCWASQPISSLYYDVSYHKQTVQQRSKQFPYLGS